jgi:hypothetical protein
MDLDDLKRRWEAQDSKLDAGLRLNASLLQATVLQKTRGALRWLSVGLWLGLLCNALSVLLLGSFWFDHLHEPRFLIPGVALHLGALALLIAGVHQLWALSQVDYGAPVIEIQRQLGAIRTVREREVKWTLLLAPLAWTPLLIVALKGLLGIDAYATLGAGYLAANVGFGLAVLVLALWIAKRYAARMEGSPWVKALLRSLAGYSLNRATGFVESLDRFERS